MDIYYFWYRPLPDFGFSFHDYNDIVQTDLFRRLDQRIAAGWTIDSGDQTCVSKPGTDLQQIAGRNPNDF